MGREIGADMNLSGKIEIADVSDVGKRRPHNEDSTLCDISTGLVILADGMGGYKAGEVASAIAVTTTHKYILDELEKIERGAIDRTTGLSQEATVVKNAIIHVNSEIYNTAQIDPQCQGMGTTMVVVLFHNNVVTMGHVGDSRLYRIRQNNFSQVTKDHSLIQELIDRGLYTRQEAEKNTPKNLVTRAIGIEPDVQVDIAEETVYHGDIYMLCSDGLNDMVDDEEIHLTLSKYSANLAQGANELVRLANKNGGKDNISVVLIRVLADFSITSRSLIKKIKSRFF
jgi:serine/threonine protein phosphatase PrpC